MVVSRKNLFAEEASVAYISGVDQSQVRQSTVVDLPKLFNQHLKRYLDHCGISRSGIKKKDGAELLCTGYRIDGKLSLDPDARYLMRVSAACPELGIIFRQEIFLADRDDRTVASCTWYYVLEAARKGEKVRLRIPDELRNMLAK
jgi:hypothetical protein